MRINFMKAIRLLLLPLLTASSSGAQTTSWAHCPLDPGFEDLQEGCARGDEKVTPETCAAARFFELLLQDEPDAAVEVLDREFGYSEASREKVMPWLELFAKAVLDTEGPADCTTAQAEPVLEIARDGLFQNDPEAIVFLGRILGFPDTLLDAFEQRRLDPATIAASGALSQATRQILLSTEAGRTALNGLKSNPFVGMMGGQLPSSSPGPTSDVDEAILRVDMALELAQEKNLEEARKVVSQAVSLATDPIHKAKVLARAGVGFLVAELREAALDYLLQADTLLEGHRFDDGEPRILQALTRYFLALAYRELGLEVQEKRVMESAKRLVEPGMGEVLRVVGESFVHQELAVGILLEKISSGELGEDELKPLMRVLGDVVPGLNLDLWNTLGLPSEDSTDESSYIDEVLQLTEHVHLKRYDEAAAVAEGLIARYPSYNNIYLLSVVAGKQFLGDDHEGALRNIRKTVDALETKIETFRVGEAQTSFVDHRAYLIFRLAVEMAGQAHRVEDAFEYAERGRAWTLRRVLGDSPSSRGSTGSEMSPEERETLADIHKVESDLRTASEDQEEALEEELSEKRDSFVTQRLARKLGQAAENPLAIAKPVSLDRLRNEILPPRTTLLVFAEGTDDLWAWVIDQEAVEMVLLPLPEQQRTDDVLETVREVSRRGVRRRGVAPNAAPARDALTALSKQLIDPVAEYLRHDNLIVVPHGVLHHLPFAALRNPTTGNYLVEDFTLSLAPSGSALRHLLPRDATVGTGTALVLGDSVTELEALPSAREEAVAVADLVGAEPLLGLLATKTAVLDRADDVALLHLAAHGEYLASSPAFSRIWLSSDGLDDGLVEMHEVWDRWHLPKARLVTLSGCQTALSELTRGDEVLGLTQAFLVAGSHAVLSTLWSVGDEPSEKLVVAFYQNLLGGMNAASALREAQRELIGQKVHADPFFWAGYTLTGDPRVRWQAASPRDWEGGRPAPVRRWPAVVATALGLFLLSGVAILGFILPARFPSRLGVVFSTDEDMADGYFHRILSAKRFFRSARAYVGADRLKSRAAGAIARIRASRRGVRILPLPGHTLWVQSAGGEWRRLPNREHRARLGTVYRDERGTVFFRLRRG